MRTRLLQSMLLFRLMVVVAAGVLTVEPVAAQDDVEAKMLYKQGTAAFAGQDYELALEKFKGAFNASGKPGILYNIAVCSEKLGNIDRAIAYFELYLAEMPDADDVEEVLERIEQLKNPDAAPTGFANGLDETTENETRNAESTATEKTVAVPAQIEKQESSGVRTPGGADGSTAGEATMGIVMPMDENMRRRKIVQGLMIGTGGLLMSAGGLTAIAAYNKYDAYKSVCAPNCSDAKVKAVKTRTVAADVQIGVGLATLATGIVWMIVDGKKGESSAPAGEDDMVGAGTTARKRVTLRLLGTALTMYF